MIDKPHIIAIPNSIDERGQINFLELDREIDFAIKRIYYISNVNSNKDRGHHAHKELRQLMIAVGGIVEVELDDGKNKYNFKLDSLNKALYIPKGYWRILKFSDAKTVCFVCASEKYSESDYIKDYQEFLKYKSAN